MRSAAPTLAALLLACSAPAAPDPDVAEPSVAEPSVAEPSVAEPSVAEPGVAEPTCLRYHFTRVLPGTGLDASVAADGTIVAVSELDGAHTATVLDRAGNLLGAFRLDPFSALVRAAPGGEVLAAAADGRARHLAADGSVRWTAQLDYRATDLLATSDGGAIVAGQRDGAADLGHGASAAANASAARAGLVTYLNAQGAVSTSLSVRAAPFLAADGSGRLALTSRDACHPESPCGADFDPNAVAPPTAGAVAGGSSTSAIVLLDPARHTSAGFIANIDSTAPVGPLFIRTGLLGPGWLVAQASAAATVRQRTRIDLDPSNEVTLRDVDTDAAPDHLVAFSGRNLVWDRAFPPLDDSGRAYIIGLFANSTGVVVDINGDVYKTHHLLYLAPDGQLLFRYDKPNDGIANDVRLAGLDDAGHVILSGRFEGTQDFDPSSATDTQSATPSARRYITALSACPPNPSP